MWHVLIFNEDNRFSKIINQALTTQIQTINLSD